MLLQGALHSNSLFHPFQNVSFLLEKCALICICPVFYYLMSSSQETKKSQFHKAQHIDHKLCSTVLGQLHQALVHAYILPPGFRYIHVGISSMQG